MDVTMDSKVNKTSEASVNEKFIAAREIVQQTDINFFSLFWFKIEETSETKNLTHIKDTFKKKISTRI